MASFGSGAEKTELPANRNQFTQLAHLVKRMLYELLSAEAGIYAHYQHHVYIINNILQQGHGSCRINS